MTNVRIKGRLKLEGGLLKHNDKIQKLLLVAYSIA